MGPASPRMPGRSGEVLHLPLQHLVPRRKPVTSLHCNRRGHTFQQPYSTCPGWLSPGLAQPSHVFWLLAGGLSPPLSLAEHSPYCGGHKDTHPHSPGFLHQLPMVGTGMEWDLTALTCSWGVTGVQGRTNNGRNSGDTRVGIHTPQRLYLWSPRSCCIDGLRVRGISGLDK